MRHPPLYEVRPGWGPDGGFSLTELSLAITLGIIVVGALGNVFLAGSSSLDYVIRDSSAVTDLKSAVQGVGGELRRAGQSHLSVDASNLDYDTLTFQVLGGGPPPAFGAEDSIGAFRPDWSLRYTVDAGDLVRQILDAGGGVSHSRIVARGVDGRSGMQKGFAVTRTGAVVKVDLRLRKCFQDGNSCARSMSSSFVVRN